MDDPRDLERRPGREGRRSAGPTRAALLVALLAGGCGGGSGGGVDAGNPDAPAGAFDFAGPVSGATPPASAKVIVIWTVSSGQDYSYKYGEGTSSGTQYVVSLAADPPPAEALNTLDTSSAGVGFLLLVPADTVVPDGVVDETQLPTPLGASARHAIIWRNDGTDQFLPWTADFPSGEYACGACVDSTTGFDSYTPVDCTEVDIQSGDLAALDFCNWT